MKKQKTKVCGVDGCSRKVEARELCSTHYWRWLAHGDVFAELPIGQNGRLSLKLRAASPAIPKGHWLCPTCRQAKPQEAFYSSNGRRRCKACARESTLKSKYNITSADYRRMLAAQGNRCALCGTDQPGGHSKGTFMVDHNHRTGVVRGLLCQVCNQNVVGVIEKRNISLDRLRDYLNGIYALKR